MLKLIGIARVSTQEQSGDNGQGLERQRLTIQAIAKTHNAELLKIVEIVDVSGSDAAKSVEWQTKVLPRLADPDVHLAVDAMDRLIRASDFASFKVSESCQETGTRIYTPTGVQDFTKADDVFLSGLTALMGGKEKAEIRRRMHQGKEAIRKAGGWVGSYTPMGFAYNKKTRTWSTTNDLPRVVKAYHDVAEGMPIATAAKAFGHADGNFRKILKNPIYRGVLTWSKKVGDSARPSKDGKQVIKRLVDRAPDAVITVRILAPDQQPVSDALWQEVQTRMEAIKGRRMGRKSDAQAVTWATGHLLDVTKVLDASDQHGTLHLAFASFKKVPRLFGHEQAGAWRYSVAGGTWSLHGDKLNHALDRYFGELADEGFVRLAGQSQAKTTMAAPKRDYDAEIAALKRKQAKLADAYVDELIDKEAFKARGDKLKAEISGLEALKAAPQAVEPDKEAIKEALQGLSWDPKADAATKRAWLAKFAVEVLLTPTTIAGCRLRLAGGVWMGHERAIGDLATDYRPAYKAGYLTTTEVAAMLGMVPSTLRKRLRLGKLPGPVSRVGGDGRQWTQADVEAVKKVLKV